MRQDETTEYILENWSVRSRYEPYLPPEAQDLLLSGEVYNHPRFMDGTYITTSPIKSISGRYITTSKGSVYKLATVDPLYVKWLAEIGKELDEDNPIKVIQ